MRLHAIAIPVVLAGAWTSYADSAWAGRERVAICHVVPGAPGIVRIEVSPAGVPAHVAHGDFLALAGTCDVPPDVLTCGGLAGPPCPEDAVCVDDPRDDCDPGCGGADCGGICVVFHRLPCDGGACPPGTTCIDDPRDPCDPDCGQSDCPTVCARVDGAECEGIAGILCPPGLECVDKPGDECSRACGGSDCIGQCVSFATQPCGGRNGTECPEAMACLDDPADDCDPRCGDEDCPRVCGVVLSNR